MKDNHQELSPSFRDCSILDIRSKMTIARGFEASVKMKWTWKFHRMRREHSRRLSGLLTSVPLGVNREEFSVFGEFVKRVHPFYPPRTWTVVAFVPFFFSTSPPPPPAEKYEKLLSAGSSLTFSSFTLWRWRTSIRSSIVDARLRAGGENAVDVTLTVKFKQKDQRSSPVERNADFSSLPLSLSVPLF